MADGSDYVMRAVTASEALCLGGILSELGVD
jgi:hypothetical protein